MAEKLKWIPFKDTRPVKGELCLLRRKLLGTYTVRGTIEGWVVDCITHGEFVPATLTDKWVSFRKLNQMLTH